MAAPDINSVKTTNEMLLPETDDSYIPDDATFITVPESAKDLMVTLGGEIMTAQEAIEILAARALAVGVFI